MSDFGKSVLALLTCAAALMPGYALAQPHAQTEVEDVSVATPAMDEWLKRMVGNFKWEGLINVHAKGDCPGTFCEPIKGKGNCVAIGPGPGVQCILNVSWLDIFDIVQPGEALSSDPAGSYEVPGGVSFLDPAMTLYGLDPGKSAISFMLVDNKGLPEAARGLVRGNRATFRSPCVNAPSLFNAMRPGTIYRTCERVVYIDAKPEAKLLFIVMDIEINDSPFTSFTVSLRREEPPAPARKPGEQ